MIFKISPDRARYPLGAKSLLVENYCFLVAKLTWLFVSLMRSRRKVFLESSTLSPGKENLRGFRIFWSETQCEAGWELVVSCPWGSGYEMWGPRSWSSSHPLPCITWVSTLAFSPEQDQSAARIQESNTAILEQGFELGMKEREVSIWCSRVWAGHR